MAILSVIAALGMLVSCLVHSATFVGINPEHAWPGVWILQFGILVLAFLTFLVSNGRGPHPFSAQSMALAPSRMKTISVGLFLYGLFNFFFVTVVLNKGGGPSEVRGEKVLASHGHIIEVLTQEEYQRHKTFELRGYSAAWMAFYGIMAMAFYRKLGEEVREREGRNAAQETLEALRGRTDTESIYALIELMGSSETLLRLGDYGRYLLRCELLRRTSHLNVALRPPLSLEAPQEVLDEEHEMWSQFVRKHEAEIAEGA